MICIEVNMAPGWHEFLLRLKALFLKRRLDRDMADELAFTDPCCKTNSGGKVSRPQN